MKNFGLLALGLVLTASQTFAGTVVPAPEEITVWKLQDMAQSGQMDALEELYNNRAKNIGKLPVGYAAGAGARVFGAFGPVGQLLEAFTGTNWRGKMFFPSGNGGTITNGLNRINSSFPLPTGPISPLGSFQAELVKSHPFVPEAKSELVLLNYSQPISQKENTPLVESLLKDVQVYDLMVAVDGKYGPVYVGKTWLGHYDSVTRKFSQSILLGDRLVAWYFLDFNKGALAEQPSHLNNKLKETILDPLPTASSDLQHIPL